MFGLSRILTVYAIAIPLALILGYALATPDQITYMMVGLVLFVLLLPLFIQWHHVLLIFFWNAAFNFPFLPSQPHFWMLLAVLSFGISWLNNLLGGRKFIRVPELTRPLLVLGGIVLLTGYLRGGIGVRVFGNASFGGRSYFWILGAIIGYFALSAVRIPVAKANRASRLYFLSGMTFSLSNLAFYLGPAFFFLYYFLPGEFATGQATAESGMQPGMIERFNGVTPACTALICYFLLRWGIRGIFSFARPWRMVMFIATLLLSLVGGFRSSVIMLGLLFVCQFCVEGLWRTRFLPILLGVGVMAAVLMVSFSDRMPRPAQRAVSFLPVKVDPDVKADAKFSAEWRFEMWRYLVPQIPKYLLLGKGYRIDPDELYFALLAAGSTAMASEVSMVSGDYHNGPLSTIIPLGLGGTIAFLWLLGAGIKVLYRNYRYGDPVLRNINAFFLAFFIMQIIFYLSVFGAFNTQLCVFTGLLGLSVSINGGVRKRGQVPARSAPQVAVLAGPVPVQA
jgi:hypothetical protein